MRGRTITFKDLLDTAIEVDGFALEATIRAIILKCDDGTFNIEFFAVGDVYIQNEEHGPILLDQQGLKNGSGSRLYKRFVNACELLALKMAAKATEEQYDQIESEAV